MGFMQFLEESWKTHPARLLTLMIKADQPHINYCIPAKRNETLLSEMSLAAQGNP
jgi:hypothetical protein